MNNTKTTKVNNYRNRHIIIAIGCVFLILSGIITKGETNLIEEIILGIGIIGVQYIFGKGSKFEKEDEMVKENLAKANKAALISFFVMSAVIPIVYLEAKLSPVDIGDVYRNPYIYAALAVVGIRSIAYVIFDRPVRAEEKE